MSKYPNPVCHYCKKELGEHNLKTFAMAFKDYDENNKRRLFCDEDCYKKYIKKFEVEIYNGNPIYKIQNGDEIGYVPYLGCSYYFKTIEDCRKRIDMKNISVVPTKLLGMAARGEMF